MKFIDQLAADLEEIPVEFRESVETSLSRLSERFAQLDQNLPEDPELKSSIARVFACSQFVAHSCIQKPELLIDLANSGDLFSGNVRENYTSYLKNQSFTSDAELMTLLRHFRRREMVRIAWRDLAGFSDLDETLLDLTALAESSIQFALDYLHQQACNRYGTPVLSDGSPQQIVVLGMGKLGAWELNYSSDIDLIFAFAEDGVLSDRKNTTYGEFFTRICRSLVKVLDEVTVDGFVFRTDIRLRPFGDSGPVIMTFEGMENYYQTQAREWERYAMIKARQVAGDPHTGPQLMTMLKPFVYRRYLDYGAFEELRSLKFKIMQELQRKDRMENIKLGPGGIREIEFIGQAFQLIRGGQEQCLQQRGILNILDSLEKLEMLSSDVVAGLKHSYTYLRKVENHIQQYQDKQTHDLPNHAIEQQLLAYAMGYYKWADFKKELDGVRDRVQNVFDQVFSVSQQENAHLEGHSAWIGKSDEDDLLKRLETLGFHKPNEILSLINGFKNSGAIKRLTAKGAGIIDRLVPQLLENLHIVKNPDLTLKRILTLMEAVAGRNVYLALLSENPDALTQLIRLSSASPWICDYLSHYPVLFDELLDTRSLYEPLNKKDLKIQLQQQLSNVECQDLEQLMFALRKFKQINMLRVAAADIMGVIPVMVVSDYLTYIAEVLLEEVVNQSWRALVEKHGAPPDAGKSVTGFGALGFGKLGGIEFGYGSDMDLVFLYDCNDDNALTNGKKSISCAQFYGRLGQKVMHMLNTNMLSGILYEVDMRLRPSGKSGLLVSKVKAYEDYLEKDAWTWEHQALIRGRFIAGDNNIKNEFERIRQKILALPREVDSLKKEVREMREKMRDNLDINEAGLFHLKQSKGGIADIEFIVQFGILAKASQDQELVTYTDNVRLLDGLQKMGFFSEEIAETMKSAYCTYRDRGHRETLQGHQAIVPEAEFDETRSRIEQIWHDYME